MASLTLSLNNLSLELGCACSPFAEGGYKRSRLDFAQVERSIIGIPMMGSPFYQNPYFWEIQVVLDQKDQNLLQLIYQLSDNLRRKHRAYGILCQDTIEYIIEETINTRQIATGYSLENIPNTPGVRYFGAFITWMSNLQIQRIKVSKKWLASFQLIELSSFY